MIIDIDGLEMDLDELMGEFAQLFKNMRLDDINDQLIYYITTVFLASFIANGLQEEYGEDSAELENQVQAASQTIAEDMKEKINAFLKK